MKNFHMNQNVQYTQLKKKPSKVSNIKSFIMNFFLLGNRSKHTENHI